MDMNNIIIKAVKEGKGRSLKTDVDSIVARCNNGLDLVGCIAKAKAVYDAANGTAAKGAALENGEFVCVILFLLCPCVLMRQSTHTCAS